MSNTGISEFDEQLYSHADVLRDADDLLTDGTLNVLFEVILQLFAASWAPISSDVISPY